MSDNLPVHVIDNLPEGCTIGRAAYWRRRGFLTRPGDPKHVGSGYKLDWDMNQLAWLAAIHATRPVTETDAKAGWCLRANGAEYAYRELPDGTWAAFDTTTDLPAAFEIVKIPDA